LILAENEAGQATAKFDIEVIGKSQTRLACNCMTFVNY
jgi:hypothetical protein